MQKIFQNKHSTAELIVVIEHVSMHIFILVYSTKVKGEKVLI